MGNDTPTRACLRCTYDLTGLAVTGGLVTCPECGDMNVTNQLPAPLPDKRWNWIEVVLVTSPLWLAGAAFVFARGKSEGDIAIWCFLPALLSGLVGPLPYFIYTTIRTNFHRESWRRPTWVALMWFLMGLVLDALLYMASWF